MINNSISCNLPVIGNTDNQDLILQTEELTYSLSRYFKNRKPNKDNIINFISYIKNSKIISDKDKSFATPNRIMEILDAYTTHSVNEEDFVMSDEDEKGFEEIDDTADHEKNLLSFIDKSVVELFDNIPVLDNDGKIQKNRFGTTIFYDFKDVWETLIYVANISSNNGEISFENIIEKLKDSKTISELSLNSNMVKDILNTNSENKFSKLFDIISNNVIIKDQSLINKLLSNISKPLSTFKNIELLFENGAFSTSQFITNSTNTTDEKAKRYADTITDANNDYISLLNSGEFVWNIEKVKQDLFDVEKKGNYSISDANLLKLLKLTNVLKDIAEINDYNAKYKSNNDKDNLKKKIVTYFTEMFNSDIADKRFNRKYYNIPVIHKLIPENKAKLNLSFVTKTFKKMYAALNINHQAKMYRKYKQSHLFKVNFRIMKKELDILQNEDPTLKHLPFIKLVQKAKENNQLEKALINLLNMSKLSIIDTVVENDTPLPVEELSEVSQLKFRLGISQLTYAGDITNKTDKNQINSFSFILPTNSSNKTVKVSEGIQYVKDIVDNKPVYAVDDINIKTTIINNEFNRIIHYFNKLVNLRDKENDTESERTEKANNIKIYSKNKVFNNFLNFYFCVSNQLPEINSKFFISKDKAKDNPLYVDMIKDIPIELYTTLTKLPNLGYYTYSSDTGLNIKSDVAIQDLYSIYEKQFDVELTDLRKTLEKSGLVNFDSAGGITDMIQFANISTLINVSSAYLQEVPHIPQYKSDIIKQSMKDYEDTATAILTEKIDKDRQNPDYVELSDDDYKKKLNKEIRAVKKKAELFMLLEAYIIVHNYQDSSNGYSANKGKSLYDFYSRIFTEEDNSEYSLSSNYYEIFDALQETIHRESMRESIANDYKREFNSFNTEDYGVDNAFISKPIVLSDILDMLNKVNNGETAYKYHVVVEKGKLVLKVIAIEDLPLFGKEVYDKIVGMNYYNTLMNIYDDLNLTVGDMPSFFKGDADTGWNVATTFTNLYKRLKIIVSPTVPHAPHVILPNGKKETTFKNVVLKSHVTYTPQVRGTTINLNQKITNSLDTVYSDNFLSYVLGNNAELIQKVKDKAITLYEANGLLRREEQDILDKDFISLYKDNKNEINQELLNLGFDTSYFKVDLTDAFDMSTLSFELKRAMLYNTGNSTISNDMYNKLYNWLHEPMSTNENDTVKIGNFDTKVRRLRKHTSYNLDEFEELLNNNEKKDYDSFIFYLRKDITVDFVKDNYLNNRMIFTDKNSARVLLPTDIHGTPMDLIRLFMEVYDIGRMSHDSAIKMSSSSIYPIEFWNNLDDFNSQEDAFKFLFGELGGVETIPNIIVNNYVNVKWESMGEQVSQSESDKSLISSQSKTLVFLGQKYVPYTKLYYNGRQVDTPTITGKELYEKQQAIWKYIYYSKYQKFTDSIHINGVVNTEKLRETIIDSFAKTDKLKHNDMLSLNTKILNIIDQIKELILSTDNEYIKQDYVDTLKLIQEYINTDYNKRKQDDLDTIINKLIEYNFIDRLDASKENFLFEFILPLFYNTNSVKIESLFTSIINDLLRIKTAGVKGALTPNTDIIKTNFITGELLSSMVLVDPNDWTPELHLRSTSYADGKITSDEIATSWNFKGEVKDYYVIDEDGDFVLSNDHFGNVSEITFKTEVFNTDKLDFTKSKNENVKEFTEELLIEICDNYSPDIHSNITIHYNKKDEIVAISLTRKEEGVLDILDYCKKDKHRISNGNNYIDYPVLDLNKLPKRILQGFANRIPTQSPNSMSYFNIVAFFHGKTKSTVAAPAEFIVRMGSDFDIDTLYSFIYNFMYNRKNKSFSFAEFTENEKELFDLWLVKNKLKSLTDKNISKNKPLGLKKMIDLYSKLTDSDKKNIDKIINNQLFLLKDNDYFKSINIEQEDTFAELITKIVAYEKEVNDSITELSSMNVNVDTDIISTMKRNRLYLVNKKYKLSDCIDALFNEGVLQNMKNVYKEEFDKELRDNPDLVYDLNTEKSVYNRLTDNYISVMTNPLNLPSILAPLDFGISEGNATKTTKNNLIEALDYENLSLSKDIDEERLNNIVTILNEYGLAQTISLLKEDVNFTHNPLTVLTNYRKYIAALSSKAGIGWAALHQVFSTIVELKGQDVKYVPFENMSSEDIENMTLFLKDIDGKNIPIQTDVANNAITSEGKISGYEIKGQDRSTLVSILVDDETKQFAAKLNIVAFTFSAIAGYNVLGIDFTYYTTLLSNPIVKKLENLKTFYNGNEKAAYLELLYKSGLTDLVLYNPNNSYMPYSMSDDFNDFDSMMFTLFDLFKENKEYSSNIKDLLVLLNVEGYDNELANKKNIGILLSFYIANKLGKIWGEYAVTMNKDAAGLSSLYSKIVKQYEKLQDLFKNTNVQNLLQTFGDVDFLLYSPYIDNSVKRENDIVVYNSPYEFINFLKEFDETLNRYSINISINKISTLYNTVSFKNNMSVKEILSILINTDNAGEWIDLFKNGSAGNSFLYSLLDIYAKTIDSEDGDIIENDLISLIEYLLLPQRFKGIEQVNELLENMIEKSKYIDVYKKLVDYNKYIVNGNILFTPTSHKGYALKAVVLAIDTYHNYFPYATLLWKKYEGLYRNYNGKSLAYEDALSSFKKSFKTYQILSNSTSDNINIGKDKVKGLLMLKALKAINIVDNKSLYDKYPFLRDIDISVTENGYVIIEYTKSNNIISEAVNDNTKITRFEMMLKDNTAIKNILDAKKNPIDITIKDLAEYLAEYYLLANGANYSARNLGSLIPSTYMQNPDIAKNISFDFNEDIELSTTEKFDFLLFMFTHNPELFTNYTINIYDKEYFDESLNDRNVLIRKKPFEVNETEKNDLLYHRKDNKLYFNIVSIVKNTLLVNKILDFYLASSNKATISIIKKMLLAEDYPTAIYVKLNNFSHTTRGVTVYHIPTAKELTNKSKNDNNVMINITDKENVIKVVKDAIATFEKNGKEGKAKNIEKDLVMIERSNGFIGKVVPETDKNYNSATEIYRKGWGNSANPKSFVGMKAIMISGSGTWNKTNKGIFITEKNIDDHFNDFYKPLIDKAVSEGIIYFNVGIAPGMDKVVTNYLVNVHRYSKHGQTVNNDKEIRWNILKAPDNKGVTIQISDELFTREQVKNDPDTMYLFTDNTDRTSSSNATESNVDKDSWYYKKYSPNNERIISYGTDKNPTSALFRGLPNAYPISTMKKFGINWTEEDYDLFVSVINDEISEIKKSSLLFKNLHIGKYRIGQGGLKAKLPIKLQTYLDEKLKSIGIDNTGDTPKIIDNNSIDLSSELDKDTEFVSKINELVENANSEIATTPTTLVDVLTDKLKENIDIVEGITERGGIDYIKSLDSVEDNITMKDAINQANSKEPIEQNFFNGYRPNKDPSKVHHIRPEIVAKYGKEVSTFKLVKEGVRTRTTRLAKWMENNNPKVGDYFWQINKKFPNNKVLTRITAVYGKDDPRFRNNWYKEGWIEDNFEYVKGYHSAIEFEVVTENNLVKVQLSDKDFTKGRNGIGEEISSNYDNLAFALTNPVFISPKGFEWKRDWTDEQEKWRKYMSKGIVFEGKTYRDIEQAYQDNKSEYPVGEARDNFMKELIKIKLRTYPKLIEGIKAKGGLSYLLDSTHQPTNKNSHWETGGDNAFIKLLAQAYIEVTDMPVPVSKKSNKVVETPLKGIQLAKNSMTNEEIKYVLDYIKPIIEETGFFANAATSLGKHANLMFSMGFSAWVPKRLIIGRENEVEPVWRITAQDYFKRKSEIDEWRKEGFTDIDIAEKLYDTGTLVYVYTLKNPDGSKIVPMSKKIYDILDRNFGIRSMGIYDSIIGNIYENSAKYNDKGKIIDGWITMIQYHEDTSEPYNNLTPIRVLVLGNEYKVSLDTNENRANTPNYGGDDRPSKIITVKQGDVYEIGQIDSKGKAYGRYRGHMPFVTENTGINNNLPVKLPVLNLRDTYQIDYSGRKIRIPARKLSEYAVSLTFRSVALTELDNQQLLDISTKDLSKIQDVPNSTIPIQELVEAYNNVVKSENKSKKQSYGTLKKILIDKAVDKAVEKVVSDFDFKYLDFPSTMSKQEKDDITNLILKSSSTFTSLYNLKLSVMTTNSFVVGNNSNWFMSYDLYTSKYQWTCYFS